MLRCLIALAVALSAWPGAAIAQAEWAALPATVHGIEVDGLRRSDLSIVLRELPFRAGETVTPEAWALGLSRLGNMRLFKAVGGRVDERDGQRVAVMSLTERISIAPLFSFGVSGPLIWARLGVKDENVAGRWIEMAAQYERFDVLRGWDAWNGGQGWVRDRRLFGRRLDGKLLVERLARPRPGFVVFRALARAEVEGEWSDRLAFFGHLDLFSDAFKPPAEGEFRKPVESRGALFSPGVRLGRVDTLDLRHRGWSLELRPGVGVLGDPDVPAFAQGLAELLAFASPGKRWTFGLRAQTAASTPVPAQHLLYIGGLDLVRGLPDNALRTAAYALANLEARFVAFDSSLLAVMPAVFVDAAVARVEPEARMQTALSAGGGARFILPFLIESGLRTDVAVPLAANGAGKPVLSIGAYQFF